MPSHLEDLFLRLVDMEKQCITDSIAFDEPLSTSETFPYWTNQLSIGAYALDGRQMVNRTYTVIARYIIGHQTEGFYGQPIRRLYADLPTIEVFFFEHRMLTSTNYTSPPTCLHPDGLIIQNTSGLAIFENSGLGTKQVGVAITLSIPFNIDIQEDW